MKPQNFSWIDDNVAGSALPSQLEHIEYYISQGIQHIISLTVDKPKVAYTLTNHNVQLHHLPIYSTPSDKTIKKFTEIINQFINNNEKTVIHCQFGQERTGQMLAIYLHKVKNIPILDAMNVIRQKRPTSLKTYTAINFLKENFK